MFLSGALDEPSKDVICPPPPPPPKCEGPAWGRSKVSKTSASLREIQNEQSKLFNNLPVRNKDKPEDLPDTSNGKFLLSSLLASNPIPVVPSRTTHVSDGDKSTPPWTASGTPPHSSRPSLRDIQMQQVTTKLCYHAYYFFLAFYFTFT